MSIRKASHGRIDYKLPESSCTEIESTATLTLKNCIHPEKAYLLTIVVSKVRYQIASATFRGHQHYKGPVFK